MTVERIGQYISKWGEGPIWWQGFLYYVDIESHLVVRFDPQSGEEKTWPVGERVGTVVPRRSGGLVIAGDRGFSFLDEESGVVTPIADPESEKGDNRFNDGKCSPEGDFFSGSISLVKKEGDAWLYRLGPDLQVSEAYGPVTNSNGLAWSADGKTLYYIDTPKREVLAFDFVSGELSNPRQVVDTKSIDASPDGMTIDENGHLWVAFCHGGVVVCYDPSSGAEVRRVELPCIETTAVAFGGENLNELYVTTGIHKELVEEGAGSLFVVKGLGVKGVPAFAFAG